MAKPSDMIVNYGEKTITFGGGIYKEWSHVRWLRDQLAAIETHANVLWGKEGAGADNPNKVIDIQTQRTVLRVIEGGGADGNKA